LTDELPTHYTVIAEQAAAEARRQAARERHRGTPSHNEAIENRIADEVTADALARKREREARIIKGHVE
jgi:hypothetical protein